MGTGTTAPRITNVQSSVDRSRRARGTIWALGFVSLFMDISSEMIHSLLPIFVVSVLGASATALGLLEGIAEGTVNIVKIFSGALSDWMRKRKPLALLGYGIAALTKPLFPLANSFSLAFTARVIDRIGKGIREAPRDALIADLTPGKLRGAAYGLRQSLDTVGAVAGPLSAILLMILFNSDFRRVFWIAVIPASISVMFLALFVHEPVDPAAQAGIRPRLDWKELRQFSQGFWFVTGIGAIFTLARFSEAFLILRANGLGVGKDYVPLVLIIMNVLYAASSYPAGRLSDRIDRRLMLAFSAVLLMIADLFLATTTAIAGLIAGISFWGLHMGFSQSLLAAMVADAAPVERRGTAFGLFNLITGLFLVISSIVAGMLWDQIGPKATFYAGACFTMLALLGLLIKIVRNQTASS